MLCALHALRARGSARKPGKSDRDSLLHLPVRNACPRPVGLHYTGDSQPGHLPRCHWLGAVGHSLAGTDALWLPVIYREPAVSLCSDHQYLHTLEPVMTALLAFFLLDRILTALQWLGLGLIVVSVTVMQLSALLHSRKTRFAPDRVPAGEAR